MKVSLAHGETSNPGRRPDVVRLHWNHDLWSNYNNHFEVRATRSIWRRIPVTDAPITEPFRRAIVEYHRKEAPGTILIDTDARYLYYVLPDGKAIRYGVAVGEEAMAWSGVAKVGRMTEWPSWTPTEARRERMACRPTSAGPANPMGARAMYLFQGNKDTLYRIHGTNQPEYIGQAISSGCIRMTNEDVIDLYKRVKPGTVVVVLAPHQGDLPDNSQLALQGGGNAISQ